MYNFGNRKKVEPEPIDVLVGGYGIILTDCCAMCLSHASERKSPREKQNRSNKWCSDDDVVLCGE
jgi:hypothetical protein